MSLMHSQAIHPQAIVDPTAKLAADVEVGPFTVIGPNVEIGAGTVVKSHVVIKGPTTIGAGNTIYQFSSIGEDTPDLKYKGEFTRLEIGDCNVIREGVTLHRGTVQDRGVTTIGSDNLIMAYAHVGHDSIVGNHTILVNNVALAGHVIVEDWAVLGGYTLVHQHCCIGAHSFSGMGTAIGKDVPPFVMVYGSPAEAKSINAEGLKRRGFSKQDIATIMHAYKLIYRRGLTVEDACKEMKQLLDQSSHVQLLIDALKKSTRGIVR